MLNSPLKANLFRFVVLMLIQLVVLDNLRIHGFNTPYIYVLFILLLPVRILGAAALLIAFGTGIIMDIFSDTFGIHGAASTLIAFLRPFIMRVLRPPMGYGDVVSPGIRKLGFVWFLKFISIMVAIHHIFLFFIEAFSFNNIHFILLNIALSAGFTLVAILMFEFLFFKRN